MVNLSEHYFKDIAEICHEANRAYCISIGDNSQPSWENAPDWQKSSAVNGVKFHYKNREATPADSHMSWYLEKIENGWKHGPVKDEVKKEHPCMVPYTSLPIEQQIKDHIFRSTCHAMFAVYNRRGMEHE